MKYLTVRGNHLQCDGRKLCLSCSGYTWPPNSTIPKKYYYCKQCNWDYLCDVGLYITCHYTENGEMIKKIQCNQCYQPVDERIWPENAKKINQDVE